MSKQNVALVAGATGIGGNALVELLSKPDTQGGPWKVYALARRARPDWLPSSVEYLQCDLLNRDEVLSKLSALTDLTHLFWMTWVARDTEIDNCRDNEQILRNALDAIVPNAENFQHIALTTGTKQYVGSFESAGADMIHDNPFTEDMSRSSGLNFYYNQEDLVYEVVEKSKGKLTWSVHRPGIIIGVTEGNVGNLLGTIAVYAAICKHEKIPFKYPGNEVTWNLAQDASNADLVAEQEVWAATDPRGKNEAFNTLNGDQFRWRRVWKTVAEKLGVEYVPFDGKPALTAESMKNMEPVWDKIVEENGLRKTKLSDVGHWWLVDLLLAMPTEVLTSMNKSREHGFFGFRNTEKTILEYIDRMRERRVIP